MKESTSLTDFPELEKLRVLYEDSARDCTKCKLHATRKNVVFGVGHPQRPKVAFLGEAPGAEEDESGHPFIGQAGKLLDKMIDAMGFDRLRDTYILNSAMCRPPDNRTPEADELTECRPFVVEQLRIVQPQYIVCLGTTAMKQLLQTKAPVGEARGKWHAWEDVPVRVTYHPAYLLRMPRMKPEAWKDLQAVMEELGKGKGG